MKCLPYISWSGIIIYMFTLITAVISNFSSFIIINSAISVLVKVLYFMVLLFAIASVYISKDRNTIVFLFVFLPVLLLFSGIPFKIITIVLLFPIFFLKDIKPVIKKAGIVIYSVFILLGVLGFMISQDFGDFGANTILEQQYSPNESYRCVTIDSDQGALGGDTYVELERLYCGILKQDVKTLYHGHWGETPEVTWVDNNTININGRNMNIHTCKTWENKI